MVNTEGSRWIPISVLQFEAALDVVDAFRKRVECGLLAGQRASVVTQVLQKRSLADLQVGQPRFDLAQLALDTVLPELKTLQVFKDQIFDAGGHDPTVLYRHLACGAPVGVSDAG